MLADAALLEVRLKTSLSMLRTGWIVMSLITLTFFARILILLLVRLADPIQARCL
jgi:hypothetical protein